MYLFRNKLKVLILQNQPSVMGIHSTFITQAWKLFTSHKKWGKCQVWVVNCWNISFLT